MPVVKSVPGDDVTETTFIILLLGKVVHIMFNVTSKIGKCYLNKSSIWLDQEFVTVYNG